MKNLGEWESLKQYNVNPVYETVKLWEIFAIFVENIFNVKISKYECNNGKK